MGTVRLPSLLHIYPPVAVRAPLGTGENFGNEIKRTRTIQVAKGAKKCGFCLWPLLRFLSSKTVGEHLLNCLKSPPQLFSKQNATESPPRKEEPERLSSCTTRKMGGPAPAERSTSEKERERKKEEEEKEEERDRQRAVPSFCGLLFPASSSLFLQLVFWLLCDCVRV